MENMENRYLDRLSDLYPTIAAASTEIINLQAILNLPKGTEHFLTDAKQFNTTRNMYWTGIRCPEPMYMEKMKLFLMF